MAMAMNVNQEILIRIKSYRHLSHQVGGCDVGVLTEGVEEHGHGEGEVFRVERPGGSCKNFLNQKNPEGPPIQRICTGTAVPIVP